MGRMYTVSFSFVSISSAGSTQDFFYLKPAADKPCKVHRAHLESDGTTDQAIRVRILRLPATVTVGSGGSAPTPTPMDVNDAAAGATTRINDTTVATTSGTAVVVDASIVHTLSGYDFHPTPEERPKVANAEAIVVRLEAAPGTTFNCSGTLTFEEGP